MSNKKIPLVSVIIPTYNHGRIVSRSIDSVLEQSYKVCEIIVVDDGSTDNTKEVLEPYLSKIKYIYQENKGNGPSIARNTGIEASKGDYIQFLDADDIILPQGIETQVGLLEEHPDIDVVACRYRRVDSAGKFLLEQDKFTKKIISVKDLVLTNLFASNALLFRRKCFTSAGLFDEDLNSCEDWDMWIRIAAKNHRFLCHNRVLCQHFRYPASLIQSAPRMCNCVTAFLNKLFANSNLDDEIKALKNEAYRNVFLKCSRGFYSSNNFKEGRLYFIKAIKADPSVLIDYSTFYNFDFLFKPLRYHYLQIKLEKLEIFQKEIFSILKDLYSEKGLPLTIKQIEKQAYSNAYFGVTLRYNELKEIKKFLRFFKKSLRMYPKCVLNPSFIYAFLRTLFGTKIANTIVRLKSRVR